MKCIQCGKEIKRNRLTQKFCGTSCRVAWNRIELQRKAFVAGYAEGWTAAGGGQRDGAMLVNAAHKWKLRNKEVPDGNPE